MVMKWELNEKYEQQFGRYHKHMERYKQRVQDAGQHVKDLTAELEAILRREFSEGTDLADLKAKQRDKISAAEKEYENAKAELEQAKKFAQENDSEKITLYDLVVDWNRNYQPMVFETQVKPVLDRIAKAREEYLNALFDLLTLKSQYDNYRRSHSENMTRYYRSQDGKKYDGGRVYPKEVVSLRDAKLITGDDLYYVEDRKKLPDDVKRIPTKGVEGN